ncbi:hypothetical protein BGZ74_009431 [Mortierella antarctica]|nr:hypothetical protein BGZ74_009431 [Mortierella antarctica]
MERLKGEGVQEWLKQHFTSPWHGHQTVASELSSEIISNIQERCSQLDASVRLGVLFSLISLKKAQQVQLRDKCQAFIDHGCTDADEWVRLVSQMLRDYPTNGTLRFNIEQFADQGALSAPLAELQKHIATDGFKFHPKEYAYLNDTVCRVSQGKDPKATEYPPVTGPSLQQHFSLRDSSTVDKERGERLRKLAEQSSPILPMSASIAPPTGQPSAPGTAPVPSAAAGSTGSAPSAPILGGPPRPPAKSSSGLFVKKPAGSFLRNNAPRPMSLARNPSVSSLPLRSPRIDAPLATPRLNQKSSRIQILDIQQGTEIMQTMNAEKLRKEQADQREKELKRGQRAQEQELKRQQDAEKKAQLAREKEEKKKEREDAKKAKERQKHEREELYQLQQREREREKEEREREREQNNEHNNNTQTRSLPDDDDDEASLSSVPARKKSRPNSSRDDDEDYDNDQAGPSSTAPLSPVTPLAHSYSHHGIDDRPTPMETTYADPTDSYFSSQRAQQEQHTPPVSDAARDHPTLFQDTNLLTPVDRAYIIAFLEGHPVLRPNMNDKVYQIVMNQEQVQDATGRTVYELILIEMNFETGEWRKIKRKRNKPHNPAMATGQ